MKDISSEELEERFDAGEDLTAYMDRETARRPNLEKGVAKRISIDMPANIVMGLDKAAARMGVNRQAVIKVWLSERLDLEEERERRRIG